MNDIRIIGNGHPIPLISGWKLAEKEKKEFNWMEDVDANWFFRYRGRVYSLDEFSRPDIEGRLKSFDGYLSDSFFSGIAIKLGDKDDNDMNEDFVRAYTFIS
jgi:hypothetical protein